MTLALPNPERPSEDQAQEKSPQESESPTQKEWNEKSGVTIELQGMGELRQKAFRNLFIGVFAILLVFGAVTYVWKRGKSNSTIPGNSTITQKPMVTSDQGVSNVPHRTVQNNHQEIPYPRIPNPRISEPPRGPSALARAKHVRLQHKTTLARESLTNLLKQTESFHKQLQSLLSNEAGRKIASSNDAVAETLTLGKEKRPSTKTVRSWQKELETLASSNEDVELALVNIDQTNAAIDEIVERVDEASEQYEGNSDMLTAIVADAQGNVPASVSLRIAIRNSKREQAGQRLRSLTEQKKELQMEEQARILAARKKIADAKAEVKREELRKQQIIEQRRQAKAKRESELQAAMPEIRQLLQPFISNGRFQPTPGRGGQELTIEVGPMSLTNMQAAEMLNQDYHGRDALFREGGWHNDRPTGGFPKYVYITNMRWQDYEIKVKTAQNLLIRFGDLMVEAGLLAP